MTNAWGNLYVISACTFIRNSDYKNISTLLRILRTTKLSLLLIEMGTNGSILGGGDGEEIEIIQDSNQRCRWSHMPQNYQFISDTKLRGSALCNTWAKKEFRIISKSWKTGPKIQEKKLQDCFGNTDVLTSMRREICFCRNSPKLWMFQLSSTWTLSSSAW